MKRERYDSKINSTKYPFIGRTRVAAAGQGDGWRLIDGRTIWHNPYKNEGRENEHSVLIKYFDYLLTSYDLRRSLHSLSGIDGFVCQCYPQDCHGDILAAFLDARPKPDLRYHLRLAYSLHDRRWTCSFNTTFIRGYDLYSIVRVAIEKYHQKMKESK